MMDSTDTVKGLPIRQKLMLAIVGTSFAVVFICSIVYIGFGWFSSRERISDQLGSTAEVFANTVSAAVSFNDEATAREMLFSLQAMNEVRLSCIYHGSVGAQRLFAAYERKDGVAACPDTLPDISQSPPQLLEVIKPIRVGPETVGYIYFQRGVSDLWDATQLNIAVVALMVLISIVLAVAISSLLQEVIAGPIQSLVTTTRSVSSNRDYSIRARKVAQDEVGQLFDSFNDMLEQIQRRDEDLRLAQLELEKRINESESANHELQETLERLRRTQEQLVNTEKMASLGGLVAGVAHEINTPIGVGVTAASTLKVTTEEAARDYEEGHLTNTGLKKYLAHATQSASIILGNLNRAAELIHSFKQVAVDQSSSESRRFRLREYLDEILLSLRPKIKKTRVAVEVNCDENLKIESYPGALSQIMTNLVMNSLSHAYDDNQDGTITVDVGEDDGFLSFVYRDDGKGISPEHLDKVFEPFFTTRRGKGGSGLGMHIVYNLVTQQLKGQISIASELGKGTCVTMRFPVSAGTRAGVERTYVGQR